MTISDITTSTDDLIQHISQRTRTMPRQVVAFIAARRGEGTSTIASAYANKLAEDTEQQVLLMDASRSGNAQSVGVAEAYAAEGAPDTAIHRITEHLSQCIWAGAEERRKAVATITNDTELWNQLRTKFSAIVIDMPPLQDAYEGVTLTARADGVVVVFEAEKTPEAVVQHLCTRLTGAGAHIIGLVMNKRQYYIPPRLYARL